MTKLTQAEKVIKFKTNIPDNFGVGKRHCYTVVDDSEIKNNYRVAKVFENESGYYPLGKSKPDNTELDKFVSDDRKHIQSICDSWNERLSLSKNDIDDIIHNSILLQHKPWLIKN